MWRKLDGTRPEPPPGVATNDEPKKKIIEAPVSGKLAVDSEKIKLSIPSRLGLNHTQTPGAKHRGPKPEPRLAVNKSRQRSSGRSNRDKSARGSDWDPAHFRLFVGNLGKDVTTAVLEAAFAAYPSMAKAQVVFDRAGKSRGYGFVAFASSEDYFKAFQEKNHKYIGSQPVQLKRAQGSVPR